MIDISHYQAARSDATNMADPFEKVKKKRSFFSFFRKDKSKSVSQTALSQINMSSMLAQDPTTSCTCRFPLLTVQSTGTRHSGEPKSLGKLYSVKSVEDY